MVFQLFILAIVIIVSPLVPPVLVPLSYSMTGALLLQGLNPWVLSIVSVLAAALTDVIIRIIQGRVIEKISIYEQIDEDKQRWIHRTSNKINAFFKKQRNLSKLGKKREEYGKTKKGKVATFFFAIFCYIPIIPDIISTRLLYKKIDFPYFLIAVIIGKSITHIPFIFLGKWLLQLIGL